MAWSKIDEGSGFIPIGSSSTTVTFNVALSQNDIVIAVFGDDDGLGVADFLSSGWSTLNSNAGVDPGRLVMYKRMGATPDTSFSFDQDGQVRTAYVWQVWRGADTATAIDATATTATGASGLPDAPSYTPVTNGALVFAVGILDDDDASASLAAPTGYTNLLAADTGQGSTTVGATVMIASKELATAAAENPAAFTGGSGTDAWAAITFALRPAASSTNALLANDVSSGTPTVGTPAIGQVHALLANDVASGTPSASTPALGQKHALLANDVAAGAPSVTSPGIGQVHGLLADDVATGAPSVSTPAIGQVHVLDGADIASGTPTVSAPALGTDGTDALSAEDISAGTPTVGTPALGQVHALLAESVSAGVPGVSSPALGGNTGQRGDDAPSGRNRFYVTRHYYVIEQPEPRKKRKPKPRKPVTQAVVEEAISTLPQWAAAQFTPASAMQAP
jgi:hypothetical protein